MTLSSSSVLHWWSARYGEVPTIGGYPTFTRNTAGTILDRSGKVISALPNTPRRGWDTINGEKRQTLLLEMARTQNLSFPLDFSNSAWVKSNCTVATGVSDPMGGTSACTLTATGANGNATLNMGNSSSLANTNSIWIRRRTGTGTVYLVNPATTAFDAIAAPTAFWQRYSIAGTGIYRYIGVQLATSGDAVDVWCAQNELGSFATSEITTGLATRAADNFYWDFLHLPQALMAYIRFVERGAILTGSSRVLDIGTNAADTGARLLIEQNSSNLYEVAHNNGSGWGGFEAMGAGPSVDNVVELVAVLFADGSVVMYQSINGGTVTSSSTASANTLASAWSAPRLYINSSGTSGLGAGRYAEVKVVKYADVVGATAATRLAELAAFELDGHGNQL